MQFNLILCGPHSTASDLVIAFIPDLDIAEGTTKGEPVQTQVVVIDRIVPGLFNSIHFFPTVLVILNVP